MSRGGGADLLRGHHFCERWWSSELRNRVKRHLTGSREGDSGSEDGASRSAALDKHGYGFYASEQAEEDARSSD